MVQMVGAEPIDATMRSYVVLANADSVCVAVILASGQRLDVEMSHEQAAHLAMRLREALAMGPQVKALQ